MPKVKSHSGSKKRFAVTATGKIKCKHAFKRHNLRKRGTKLKRNLTQTMILADCDVVHVVKLLNLPQPRYRKMRHEAQHNNPSLTENAQ